jgi:hypothetical protein
MHDRPDDDTAEPIPEADAIEQAMPADDRSDDLEAPVELPDDAPEADAIEQATPVTDLDDDDAPR